MANDKSKPILVTGATGYIASWVVKYLLQDGYTVHATVRDKSNKNKIELLDTLSKTYPNKLFLFEADLLKKDSFKEAMQDCEVVIHMASPFVISGIKDAEKELINPALQGTRNVLDTVNATETVKKVVLTSSVAAIYGDSIDMQDTRNGIFDESIWNTTSSIKHQPYSYSKKVAEKEAWKMQSAQERWQLVTINPGFVFGPSLTKRSDSTSIDFMINMLNGKLKVGVPKLTFGVVDVRDVARAHINAFENENAKGRNILVAESLTMKNMADVLSKQYSDKYPIPKNELPNILLYAVGPLQGFSWKFIQRNIDMPLTFNNSKSIKELGIKYIETDKSIIDHAEQIIQSDLI